MSYHKFLAAHSEPASCGTTWLRKHHSPSFLDCISNLVISQSNVIPLLATNVILIYYSLF